MRRYILHLPFGGDGLCLPLRGFERLEQLNQQTFNNGKQMSSQNRRQRGGSWFHKGPPPQADWIPLASERLRSSSRTNSSTSVRLILSGGEIRMTLPLIPPRPSRMRFARAASIKRAVKAVAGVL